jgi:hypothetical protein
VYQPGAADLVWTRFFSQIVSEETVCATCLGDLDGSGTVDGGDIGVLLLDWGQTGPADFDRSGAVDGGDIGVLLLEWGDCGP